MKHLGQVCIILSLALTKNTIIKNKCALETGMIIQIVMAGFCKCLHSIQISSILPLLFEIPTHSQINHLGLHFDSIIWI